MTDEPTNGVRISNAMIYEQLQLVAKDVSAIRADFRVHQELGAHPQAIEDLADHEVRLRSIEGKVPDLTQLNDLTKKVDELRIWVAKIGGVAAALMVAGDVALRFFGK